jgi:Holin of 3TMs, for gene-transfer release
MNKTLSKILGGVAAVAPTVANLVMPGSGSLVHTLMRTVTGDGPETPIEKVAAKIEADPKLFIELQRLSMDHEARMEEVKAKKLATVNATMQVESKSEHWPQWLWRPFNGFLFGISIVSIYFILPICKVPVPAVPEWIWIGWGAILGVTTWDRGKEKRAAAGEIKPGLITGVIKAIKGDK